MVLLTAKHKSQDFLDVRREHAAVKPLSIQAFARYTARSEFVSAAELPE
jgi:hypothetical protein